MRILLALLWLFCLMMACGGSNEAQPNRSSEMEDEAISVQSGDTEINISSQKMEEAMKRMEEAFSAKDETGEAVEVVDYQKLKALLPDRAAGIKQEDASGERTTVMGFSYANATGIYRDQDRRLEVTLSDFGGVGMLKMSMAAWTGMTYSRESDDGYERTAQIKGYPGMEKYDRSAQRGEISVFVADRFLVALEGTGVSEKDLQKALDQINFRRLERLQ